jgi:hypothetical protein
VSVHRTEIDIDDRAEAEDAAEETDAEQRVTPKAPNELPRHCQDTRKVSGERATHMPPDARESDLPEIQG